MIFIQNSTPPPTEDVEEASYLASASDLMVGLLFVFIIMVVMLSQRVILIETKPGEGGEDETAVQTIEEPYPVIEPQEQIASVPPKTKEPPIVTTVGERLRKAGVEVSIDATSGVITLPADALFAKGYADLRPGGVEMLNKAKLALDKILPCYIYSERNKRSDCPANEDEVEIETIFIEGHTDSAPLPLGIYTNWHLGLDRARAVYDLLTIGPMQQYKNERTLGVVGISSYADKRPNKDNPSDDAKNRRVELRFVLAYKANLNAEETKAGIQNRLQEAVKK
jgi:chemotaxis protein MotB